MYRNNYLLLPWLKVGCVSRSFISFKALASFSHSILESVLLVSPLDACVISASCSSESSILVEGTFWTASVVGIKHEAQSEAERMHWLRFAQWVVPTT